MPRWMYIKSYLGMTVVGEVRIEGSKVEIQLEIHADPGMKTISHKKMEIEL